MKNIIFDIGNVIAHYKHDEVVKHFTDKDYEMDFIKENIVNSPEWSGYGLVDIGFLTWDEIIKILEDRTNHINDKLIEDYCKNHYKYLDVREEMLNLIKLLKEKGYKVYLLSNTNEDATNHLKKSGLFELVDGYVLSHLENQVKPHEGIYKTLINRYNLDVKSSVFIDDRLDNCETATRLGMLGINVIPDNYEDIINKLKLYSII
jgi:putative hydrolase of the HAD superfamily